MTGMPAPENKSKKGPLKLVEDNNQGQEAHDGDHTMSSTTLFLKNSSTPTNAATELVQTHWGTFSRQPNYMGSIPVSSSTSGISESVLQRREETVKRLHEKPFMQQEPIDNQETEHSFTFSVKIFTYGHREKTLLRLLLNLGRNLHHGFPGNFEIEWNGNRIEYDHFAHDGEHVGHNEALKFIPLGNLTEGDDFS